MGVPPMKHGQDARATPLRLCVKQTRTMKHMKLHENQGSPWRSWRLGGSKKPNIAPQKNLCASVPSVVPKTRAMPPKDLCVSAPLR
jgi:hypothetical protein